MKAKIGEINLAYDVHGGEGPWLLLIQGLGYPRWGWDWQVEELRRDFRVIAFDNRGIGESDAPAGPYTASQMASDAVGLLDHLKVDRAHVVGHSLGGFISQEFAAVYPERIDRLVIACTHFGGPDAYPMPQVTLDLLGAAAELPEEERLRRFTANAFTGGFVADHPEVIDRIVALRRKTAQPLEAWQAQAAASLTFEGKDRLHLITAETLVVTGDEDRVVDPRNARLLADAISDASLVEIPGGHLFMIERQHEINSLLRGFLLHGAAGVAEWRREGAGATR